jgi:hypothetical protein
LRDEKIKGTSSYSGSELTERANRNLLAAVRCILLISVGSIGALTASPADAGSYCTSYTDKDGNQQAYCSVVGDRGSGGSSGGWSPFAGISGGGVYGGGSTTTADSYAYHQNTGIPISDRLAEHDVGCKRGNPIIVSTGNKVEEEYDFSERSEHGLLLARTYNHYWQGVGLFGNNWISNFDYKLTFGTTDVDACFPRPGGGACGIGNNLIIYAWRPDGRTIKFIKRADGIFYEDKPEAFENRNTSRRQLSPLQ